MRSVTKALSARKRLGSLSSASSVAKSTTLAAATGPRNTVPVARRSKRPRSPVNSLSVLLSQLAQAEKATRDYKKRFRNMGKPPNDNTDANDNGGGPSGGGDRWSVHHAH